MGLARSGIAATAVLVIIATACGSEDGDEPPDDTPQSIPDPGTESDNWNHAGAPFCTPEAAHPVGTATRSPGYLEGTLCESTGAGFYVFRAGPGLTEFSVGLGTTQGEQIDYVHLHAGDGLVFGEELSPTSGGASFGTWTVTPGNIYVLEAHAPGGGFF